MWLWLRYSSPEAEALRARPTSVEFHRPSPRTAPTLTRTRGDTHREFDPHVEATLAIVRSYAERARLAALAAIPWYTIYIALGGAGVILLRYARVRLTHVCELHFARIVFPNRRS